MSRVSGSIVIGPCGLSNFHPRSAVLARRDKYEKHAGLLVLGARKERREVRTRAGPARRNGVDYLTAIGFEAGFEGIQAVLAGREVGIGDDCGFRMQRLGRSD